MPGELRLGCRWDEPGEGIGRERRADHGCTLEDSSFCWAESIQSGRQKSLNRGRKCDAINSGCSLANAASCSRKSGFPPAVAANSLRSVLVKERGGR